MEDESLITKPVDLKTTSAFHNGYDGLSPITTKEVTMSFEDNDGNTFFEINATKCEFTFHSTNGRELKLQQDEFFELMEKMSQQFQCKGCGLVFITYWEFEEHLLMKTHIDMSFYDDSREVKYRVIKRC